MSHPSLDSYDNRPSELALVLFLVYTQYNDGLGVRVRNKKHAQIDLSKHTTFVFQ